MLFPKRIDPKRITKPSLVTIPYSHYCEMGRWALERTNIDFDEIKYSPGYHALAVEPCARTAPIVRRAVSWARRAASTAEDESMLSPYSVCPTARYFETAGKFLGTPVVSQMRLETNHRSRIGNHRSSDRLLRFA